MTCVLCWDDLTQEQQQELRPCHHVACKRCFKDWIETCENNGRHDVSCPYCRQAIEMEICNDILGRCYEAKSKTAEDAPDEVDDFTLSWLQENEARQCPHCGVWMMMTEEEDDNNPVMCRCGYCYCWTCEKCALLCDCYHSDIYDNVTGEELKFDREDVLAASEEDYLNFRAFLARRRNRELGDGTQADSHETVAEEPAEVDFMTIFDVEEPAEALFVSFLEWFEEEEEESFDPSETQSVSNRLCRVKSGGSQKRVKPRSLLDRSLSY